MKTIQTMVPSGRKINGVAKFGRNEDIDAAEIVNTLGLIPKRFAIGAASDMYISSSHAGDTSVEITVEYLDDNGHAQTVVKDLDAADSKTFVDLGVDGIAVNRAYVSDAGVTLNGDVYISSDNTDAGGDGIPDSLANAMAVIPLGDGQTMQAVYVVPSNKVAEVFGWKASIVHDGGAATKVTFRLKRLPAGGSWRTVESDGAISSGTVSVGNIWPFTQDFAGDTTLAVEAQEVSAANNDCTGQIYLRLEDA
jgi:hypothetical protein